MDYRDNRILNILLKEGSVSADALAEEFQISKKMLRKQIRAINEELRYKGIPEIHMDADGNMMFLESSDQLADQVRSYVRENDYYTYRLNPNERKTITTLILLNSEGYVTAAALADYLCISRNTLLHDIDELKRWFSENGMTLCSRVQKGYSVEASEEDIRNGILRLMQLNFGGAEYQEDTMSVFRHLLLQELDYEDRLPILRTIVADAEEQLSLHLSDFSFYEVLDELLVLLCRIMIGKEFTDEEVDEDYRHSSKYPFSSLIMDEIEKNFNLQIPDAERRHYVKYLRKKSYIHSSTEHINDIAAPVIIGDVIYRICHRFHVSFYMDYALYNVLVDHMKSIVHRARMGEFLPNPFLNDIESKYPGVFKVVQECIHPLEDYIGIPLQDDEISYLAMYFAAMIERERQASMERLRVPVALVGGMGRGTMNLLKTEIGKMDDILEVVKVCSAHNVGELKESGVRMIITYVPLPKDIDDIRTVRIASPILLSDDQHLIRMTAQDILEEILAEKIEESIDMTDSRYPEAKSETKRGLAVSGEQIPLTFTSDCIRLDVTESSWEGAVRKSGEVLLKQGAVTEGYVEAMIDNIRQNGTYIVILPGLAIPHAAGESGALYEAFSLLRLKEPVCFGHPANDPVRYVIGMSILNAETINQLIYGIIQIFSDPESVRRLDAAQTPEEMYKAVTEML